MDRKSQIVLVASLILDGKSQTIINFDVIMDEKSQMVLFLLAKWMKNHRW